MERTAKEERNSLTTLAKNENEREREIVKNYSSLLFASLSAIGSCRTLLELTDLENFLRVSPFRTTRYSIIEYTCALDRVLLIKSCLRAQRDMSFLL